MSRKDHAERERRFETAREALPMIAAVARKVFPDCAHMAYCAALSSMVGLAGVGSWTPEIERAVREEMRRTQ